MEKSSRSAKTSIGNSASTTSKTPPTKQIFEINSHLQSVTTTPKRKLSDLFDEVEDDQDQLDDDEEIEGEDVDELNTLSAPEAILTGKPNTSDHLL